MNTRCTLLFTLATLLAFGKPAHAYKTYYLMGEEDKIHLDKIFKEIDKLNDVSQLKVHLFVILILHQS